MLLSPFCAQLPAEERDVDHPTPAHRPASLHAHLAEDEDESSPFTTPGRGVRVGPRARRCGEGRSQSKSGGGGRTRPASSFLDLTTSPDASTVQPDAALKNEARGARRFFVKISGYCIF